MKYKLFHDKRFSLYSLRSLQKDLLSGIVVGVVAIPLGMAFAIASGVKPEYGIYTTIIAGLLISIFGGSKFQIGGPTGAFVPILFGIVMAYGYENLLIAGFLAGVLLLLMGIFKLGSLIKFIPKPVTIGFTTGIAVTIFIGQIANFFGLTGLEKHESFLANLKELFIHFDSINLYSMGTAVICLATILISPRWFPKIPGPIIGLIFSTLIATLFFPNQVATIGTIYGDIPNTLPRFSVPDFSIKQIHQLIGPAFVIAILGAIESLLSAVVADGMTKTKHNSNKELMGQGIANMITPFFGGIPATGAIARTATNIKTGAVSPLSGMIHSLVVLAILLLFAPYASKIPLASMAPILMVVAWNMSERHVFIQLVKTKTGDTLVLVVTFLLTVFADLTLAVEVGLILAAILFTLRMSDSMVTDKVLPSLETTLDHENDSIKCPQISMFNIEGPLFFGAAQTFEQRIMNAINYKPEVLILKMDKVPFMDTTGESYLRSIVKDFSKHGVVLITGLNNQPKHVLQKTGTYQLIGEKHFFPDTTNALNNARLYTKDYKCQYCSLLSNGECLSLLTRDSIKDKSKMLTI